MVSGWTEMSVKAIPMAPAQQGTRFFCAVKGGVSPWDLVFLFIKYPAARRLGAGD